MSFSVAENPEQSNFFKNLRGVDENRDSFHWITNQIAIGDFSSSYKPFRFIVNINFPHNHCERHCVHERYFAFEETWYMVLSVGMYDHEMEATYLPEFIKRVVKKLQYAKQFDPEGKTLFHCYAGISRSTAFAIAYLVENESCSVEQALDKIKVVRPRVAPKEEYMTELKKYYSQ
jgi:Dual specificity phosphatase, catalytic domain